MTRAHLQASLNLDDPFENELYDFALKQGKASSYIKRLIYLDKLSKEGNIPTQPVVSQTPIPVYPVENVQKKIAALHSLDT